MARLGDINNIVPVDMSPPPKLLRGMRPPRPPGFGTYAIFVLPVKDYGVIVGYFTRINSHFTPVTF